MSTFKISKLAHDAGLSTTVVRDYVLRGLLHPASRTQSGHHLFDDHSLERLHFVRSLFEAGIGLNELTRLCHALDDGENAAAETLERVRRRIAARRAALSSLDLRLGNMISAMAAVPGRENGHV